MKSSSALSSLSFIIIIICAVAGYVLTFIALNKNAMSNNKYPAIFHVGFSSDTSLQFSRVDSVTKPVLKQPTEIINDKAETIFNRNPVFLIWMALITTMITIAA